MPNFNCAFLSQADFAEEAAQKIAAHSAEQHAAARIQRQYRQAGNHRDIRAVRQAHQSRLAALCAATASEAATAAEAARHAETAAATTLTTELAQADLEAAAARGAAVSAAVAAEAAAAAEAAQQAERAAVATLAAELAQAAEQSTSAREAALVAAASKAKTEMENAVEDARRRCIRTLERNEKQEAERHAEASSKQHAAALIQRQYRQVTGQRDMKVLRQAHTNRLGAMEQQVAARKEAVAAKEAEIEELRRGQAKFEVEHGRREAQAASIRMELATARADAESHRARRGKAETAAAAAAEKALAAVAAKEVEIQELRRGQMELERGRREVEAASVQEAETESDRLRTQSAPDSMTVEQLCAASKIQRQFREARARTDMRAVMHAHQARLDMTVEALEAAAVKWAGEEAGRRAEAVAAAEQQARNGAMHAHSEQMATMLDTQLAAAEKRWADNHEHQLSVAEAAWAEEEAVRRAEAVAAAEQQARNGAMHAHSEQLATMLDTQLAAAETRAAEMRQHELSVAEAAWAEEEAVRRAEAVAVAEQQARNDAMHAHSAQMATMLDTQLAAAETRAAEMRQHELSVAAAAWVEEEENRRAEAVAEAVAVAEVAWADRKRQALAEAMQTSSQNMTTMLERQVEQAAVSREEALVEAVAAAKVELASEHKDAIEEAVASERRWQQTIAEESVANMMEAQLVEARRDAASGLGQEHVVALAAAEAFASTKLEEELSALRSALEVEHVLAVAEAEAAQAAGLAMKHALVVEERVLATEQALRAAHASVVAEPGTPPRRPSPVPPPRTLERPSKGSVPSAGGDGASASLQEQVLAAEEALRAAHASAVAEPGTPPHRPSHVPPPRTLERPSKGAALSADRAGGDGASAGLQNVQTKAKVVGGILCSDCGASKAREGYSKNQASKPPAKRRCKACISGVVTPTAEVAAIFAGMQQETASADTAAGDQVEMQDQGARATSQGVELVVEASASSKVSAKPSKVIEQLEEELLALRSALRAEQSAADTDVKAAQAAGPVADAMVAETDQMQLKLMSKLKEAKVVEPNAIGLAVEHSEVVAEHDRVLSSIRDEHSVAQSELEAAHSQAVRSWNAEREARDEAAAAALESAVAAHNAAMAAQAEAHEEQLRATSGAEAALAAEHAQAAAEFEAESESAVAVAGAEHSAAIAAAVAASEEQQQNYDVALQQQQRLRKALSEEQHAAALIQRNFRQANWQRDMRMVRQAQRGQLAGMEQKVRNSSSIVFLDFTVTCFSLFQFDSVCVVAF